MADAKKCDRCGKLYDWKIDRPEMNIGGHRYEISIRTVERLGDGQRIDFCERCTKMLERFLNDADIDIFIEEGHE